MSQLPIRDRWRRLGRLMRDRKLSHGNVRVGWTVLSLFNPKAVRAMPPVWILADAARVSETTVRRAMARLDERGHLTGLVRR